MTIRVSGPAVPIPPPRVPTASATAAPRFGELVAQARAPRTAPPPPSTPTGNASTPVTGAGALTEAGRQLLARVARGERYVENVVRQAVGGRAFTPADLLAMQAQVYRYTQELELVSKLVERGTSTVKTVLQQGG
jgi:hypothetical protein